MAQKVLWTIRTTATLTAETWQRFMTKAREAGTTPARVLEDFIQRYAGEPTNDQDAARRPLRQGEHD
jgi:hypothetical protein